MSRELTLPWWDKKVTKQSLVTEIEECLTNINSSSNIPVLHGFAIATAINSITPFNVKIAVDAIIYASIDEGAIDRSDTITKDDYLFLYNCWNDPLTISDSESGTVTVYRDRIDSKLIILRDHLQALKFLLYSNQELTIETIKQTHKLMFLNSPETNPGVFRTHSAHVLFNNHTYLEPALILTKLSELLERFRNIKITHMFEPVKLAAQLFYEFVHTIHPFTDGNGRMGRLLISYILMKFGVTQFALPLNNGHSKPRKQFEATVRKFSRPNPYDSLALHILECVHRYWSMLNMLITK